MVVQVVPEQGWRCFDNVECLEELLENLFANALFSWSTVDSDDVYIDVPDIIDISHMRSKGIQPGEGLLPEAVDEGKVESEKLLANEEIVAQLVSMGFNHLHCQKAAINTSNAGVEEAMNWLLSHMDDLGYGICLTGDWQGGDIENVSDNDNYNDHSNIQENSIPSSSPFWQPLPHLPSSSSPPVSHDSRSQSPCQICKRENHQALDCYNRMNYAFQERHPPTELAAMVAEANTTYLNHHQWYADSGANIHVTFDTANLTISQPYEGTDTVGVSNGAGLIISRTGNATIKTLSSTLALNDVAYCPQASAYLLSINKFCKDNNVLFELTGSVFSVKDLKTGDTLMMGPNNRGLYPINLQQLSSSKFHAFSMIVGVKASTATWHCRLGHPSSSTLHNVLHNYSLPISDFFNKESICVSCQLVDEGKVESEKHLANEEIVAQLVSMGFNHLHCQKAAINTSNAGVEEAMNWLLSHMDDPDIDVPISQEAENAEALSFVDQSKVDTLISFGFQEDISRKGGDIENVSDNDNYNDHSNIQENSSQ
ncbi:hypothetical protein VitviT2T_004155 [Vitis vinifera]|uniref:UBA domain-containing protein n=1 Tax=Vitis vinifera TaxID=29760 RepID=A0ABY9BNM0_VITVI|nr:hypothetical protein VitviT2T_004155 [Vitis vinifera]